MRTLQQIYNDVIKHYWCDKGSTHSYIDLYDHIFRYRRQNVNKVVEVGVFQGGSMLLWHDYFRSAKIVGVDSRRWDNFDPKGFEELLLAHPRMSFHELDATEPEITHLAYGADIFIDDGSHKFEDQVRTFVNVWNALPIGAHYIIEDIKPENFDDLISLTFNFRDCEPEYYDLRANKNRYDDLVIVCRKR